MISNNLLNEINQIKKYYSLEAEAFKILASNECSIYWDRIKKKYIVEINRNQIDYFLIHEFGHIFFSKITQYPYFIKFTSEIEKVNQEIVNFINKNPMADIEDLPKDLKEFRIIHDYSVGILDCFVNYYAFVKNDTYYNFYINYIKEILKSVNKGFRPGKLRILLLSYINFYLEFNYNIQIEEKIQNQQKIEFFLNGLKKVIIDSSQFKMIQFDSLDKLLDNYVNIKDSIDHKIIISFIQNILLNLSLWNEDTLKEKLAIIYPV